MQKRELGRSGLQVSAIGYGCMGLSGSYNAPLPKSEGIRMIQSAFERASPSSIRPRFMGRSLTRSYLARPQSRSATRS